MDKCEMSEETINHPPHYGGDTTYEAIKVIEAWGLDFCLGNAVKYIARSGKKDKTKEVEDLRKALWYLNRRIEQLDGSQLMRETIEDFKNAICNQENTPPFLREATDSVKKKIAQGVMKELDKLKESLSSTPNYKTILDILKEDKEHLWYEMEGKVHCGNVSIMGFFSCPSALCGKKFRAAIPFNSHEALLVGCSCQECLQVWMAKKIKLVWMRKYMAEDWHFYKEANKTSLCGATFPMDGSISAAGVPKMHEGIICPVCRDKANTLNMKGN